MNECLSSDDITELSAAAFQDEYDADAVRELLDGVYANHSGEIRLQILNAISDTARQYNRLTRFKEQLKQYKKAYIQEQMKSSVTGVPELSAAPRGYERILDVYSCGDYILNDDGVFKPVITKDGDFALIPVCSQTLLIVERLRNIQDTCEKVVIAFMTRGKWETVVIERETISSNTKIVRLSNYGIDVTSENAKEIVKYLQSLMQKNTDIIPVCNTVNRLGWQGKEFIPYSGKIKCGSAEQFAAIYSAIGTGGDYDVWRKHCKELRENIFVRLTMAASFASPLILQAGGLPFIVHLWGGTGTGKTVALHVAASIWGKPDGGLVRTLNGTTYGINETAAFLYAFPCLLDELQTITDKTKLNGLIMCLTEGMNRTQGAASGGIKQIKQWRNCFICTGEENIVKANSGGGAVNRVIALEVQDKIIADGNKTMNIVTNNYGYAGIDYINGLKQESNLQERYRDIFKELTGKTDATDKQCMAMAFLLLADELAGKYIFRNEQSLTIADVRGFMATKADVDVSERCYKWVFDWIAQNSNRFESPAANNGEIWGKIENDYVMINKTVLSEHMYQAGFDYRAVMSQWSKKGYIERNSQGKFVHQTRVHGIGASYIKLLMNVNEYTDIIDDELPF